MKKRKKYVSGSICGWETMSVYFEGQILINSFWRNYKRMNKKKSFNKLMVFRMRSILLPSSFTLSELNHQYWSADKNHWTNNQAWLLVQCNSLFRFKQSRPEQITNRNERFWSRKKQTMRCRDKKLIGIFKRRRLMWSLCCQTIKQTMITLTEHNFL